MLVMISCGFAACSASPEMPTSASVAPPAQAVTTAAPAYQLSEKELKMNCKQLTGTMKVRMMQMSAATADGTAVARGMQAGAVKIWGGPSHGTDPAGEKARDQALLEAYNQQLAAKKCKTLDLQAEMQAAAPAKKAN
jgi:hypothetical protein